LEVYNKVVLPDFKFAAANLPAKYTAGATFPDNGRATKGAAVSHMGEAYLTMAQKPLELGTAYLDSARTQLVSMVNTTTPKTAGTGYYYSLEPDYQNNCVYAWNGVVLKPQKKLGQEIVFAVHVNAALGIGNGYYMNSSSWTIFNYYVNMFDPLDYRFESNFLPSVINPNKGQYISRKFQKTTNSGPRDHDMPLMKYSDVLILLATVENEKNNGPTALAVACVNALSARARAANGGTPRAVPADLTTAMSYSAFRNYLWEERAREAMLEWHSWFDRVRMGITDQVAAKTGLIYTPNLLLAPIPSDEITASNGIVTQNPGW
jgi:hypothetical protein